jgi:tetratricopeptide (TPR) repeat protein
MISSTSQDLPEHRQQVMNACLEQGMFPMMMEHLPASDAEAIPASLKMVDEADIYLLILANRYGYVPAAENPKQISVTEHEYNRALERKIPCLTFAMHADHDVKAVDVEKGEGAVKLEAFKARALLKGTNFFHSPEDLRGHVVNSLSKFITFQPDSGPQPLIHSLPTQQEIEGREAECAAILRAMSAGQDQVYIFTAPGGFGKTALLAKIVKTLSPDDVALLDKIELVGGEKIEPRVAALLHVDCRKDVKLSDLFANAGRLIGEQQAFEAIYNGDDELTDKLQEIFRRLSTPQPGRVWFVFDNFESMLNSKGEVAGDDLRALFSAVFAGGHRVRVLIAGREVPKFSRRERAEVLEAVADGLFDGLPMPDCVEFLKKNDGARGLTGSAEAVESVLREFASRVHRIPLALVWAVGYLHDTSFTLKEILNRADLFADFDKEQAEDADSYENKGVKRLHYEQLKIQPPESLPVLQLLAFFKRPVPRGVLAHVMHEIELSKALTRLERNRLITHKESSDAYTQFLNDPMAVNLYGLHPVICENEFFETQPDQEELFESAADTYWEAANTAYKVNRFAHALELADCAQRLFEHLIREFKRDDLWGNNAAMLISKGLALWSLTKLNEALAVYAKAIAIYERLVNEEQQANLSADLAMTYLNKGLALWSLTKLNEALAEYEKAIAIYERLVNEEQQANLRADLAMTYMNKGSALWSLTKLNEALPEYDKAIAIYEQLVNEEQQANLSADLARAYMNKGLALWSLTKLNEALAEYEKAIAIYERLVNEEQQKHLGNELGTAYVNKGNSLQNLTKLNEALAEYDKAIAIRERLVNEEQQKHLANDLAMTYMNKGVALRNLAKLNEALAEYDKAVAIYERLVNEEQQTHLRNDLARADLNKGNALLDLTKWNEALAEYDKAIAIYSRLVNEEQQTHLANDLAKSYMNRGAALQSLTKVSEALVEYDNAIAIYEPLVNEEQQTQLTNDLALAYENKALALELQEDLERALTFYEKSAVLRRVCADELNMYWIVPALLKIIRYRVMTLFKLERWPEAAVGVREYLSRHDAYLKNDAIDASLRATAQTDVAEQASRVRALTSEQRELLYAELGPEAEKLKALVDTEVSVPPA